MILEEGLHRKESIHRESKNFEACITRLHLFIT